MVRFPRLGGQSAILHNDTKRVPSGPRDRPVLICRFEDGGGYVHHGGGAFLQSEKASLNIELINKCT